MEKSKSKKKKIQKEPKLSFGSALKRNFNHSSASNIKQKNPNMKKVNSSKKANPPSVIYSKIDESYNADRGPDIFNGKEEFNDIKTENKGYLHDIPSENSSVQPLNKEKVQNGGKKEILASLETTDGATIKPFRATGLLNKSQLKLASYIKQNKNVTLQGTKRFTDKSGEYYLKNIQLQNSQKDPNPSKQMSLNNPQNLENCFNRDINKIKRKASRIVTLLPENSLTPIPKKDVKDGGIANRYGNKELSDAQRTAVFIRRMEYSTTTKRKMDEDNKLKSKAKKIALIQEWWKTMYKIIKLQKNIRGFLFRKKLMNNLEHQEKLLQFITEFDNIHSYHLYKQFMDNLKKKRDYENSKLMEKCEDFNEKLDNLEKMHNYKNFKNCFKKWKDDTKQKRKDALDNLVKKLNDILQNKEKEGLVDALNKIKDKGDEEDNKFNDKIKDFQSKNGKKKFIKDLIKAHRLNKMLNNIKNILDEKNKKDALDKLKNENDQKKGLDKLKQILENKMKKDSFDDMKTMDFVNKLDNLINNHNDKINENAKKDFLNNLKNLNNNKQLHDKLKHWKDLNDEIKNRTKILNKLKRHKLNELRKKEEEEKKKLAISSGVNDFQVISDEPQKPNKNNQIFISSSQNDININAQPTHQPALSQATQNFSLIAPELNKFEIFEPIPKNKKLDKNKIIGQLDDVDSFLNNNLNNINKDNLTKFDFMEPINKNSKIERNKIPNQLDETDLYFKNKNNKDILTNFEFMEPIPKNNKLDKNKIPNQINNTNLFLKNKSAINEGLKKLDKFINNKLKKDGFDKLKKVANARNAIEDLDKLLLHKYRQKFLDNLKGYDKLSKILDNVSKILKKNNRKEVLGQLKKRNDLIKGIQKMDKILNDKSKKDAFNTLKNNDKIAQGSNNLEKLLANKFKKKFFDRLKKDSNIRKACDKLEKLINNKLKDAFDKLKNYNNFKKAIEQLDKLLNDKIKDDKLTKLKNLLNNLKKIADDSHEEDKNKLKKAMDHWKNLTDKKDILKNIRKQKLLGKTIRNADKVKNNNDLKKYYDKWKENAFNSSPKSKRISRRRSPKKSKNKSKKKNYGNKKLLKKAFKKWKENASFIPTRNLLQQIKNSKNELNSLDGKDDLYEKYKKKVVQVLLNIYKSHRDSVLKKYFDRWKKVKKPEKEKKSIDITKYKKKPKLFEQKDDNPNQDSNLENTSFKPKYYIPKQNLHNYLVTLYKNPNIFSNEKNNPKFNNGINNKPEKYNYEPKYYTNRKKNIPYEKKYFLKNSDYNPSSQNHEELKNNEIPLTRVIYPNNCNNYGTYYPNNYTSNESYPNNTISVDENDDNYMDNENYPYDDENYPYNNQNYPDKNENYPKYLDNRPLSDNSSFNESLLNGVTLIENKKVIEEPRIYTSQSFFVNKNAINDLDKNNKFKLNKKNKNNSQVQLPMTMKGDFVSLIRQNPELLTRKNPRIQVTNATCDLSQIINNENIGDEDRLTDEEINNEIKKLDNNFIIDKNKLLKKVIQNCDKDLYSSPKDLNSKNPKWFSVSIPLNNNEAKWKFLNNIKGERDKNNSNKFELIQKGLNENKKQEEEIGEEQPYNTKTRTIRQISSEKRSKKNIKDNKDNSYKLQEMNYTQFYRSPVRTPKRGEEEKLNLPDSIIKNPGKRRKLHESKSYLTLNDENNKSNGRIINNKRNKGNLFSKKFKSIDYDDENEDYNDLDE